MAQPPTRPSRLRAARDLPRLRLGLIALAATLTVLAQLGYLRPEGALEVALTDAGGRPVPCALVLPELVAPWPAWTGAGGRTAIGIASNNRGVWRETLPPGVYRIHTSLPTLPPQPDQVVYPWWTTRLAVRLPSMAPSPPAFLNCPAAPTQPPPGGQRSSP